MRAVYNFTQKRQNLSASCRFPLKLAPAAAGGVPETDGKCSLPRVR